MALNKATLINDIKTTLEGYTFKVTLPGGTVEWRQFYDFTQEFEGQPENFNPAMLLIKTIINKTVDHIVSEMEIKGIETTLDTGLNSVFTAGVPVVQDGGATLQTAWKSFTAVGAADNGTQNNDGKGHVE